MASFLADSRTRAVVIAALVGLIATGAVCWLLSGAYWDIVLAAGAMGVLLTALAAGSLFMVFFTRNLAALRLEEKDLAPTEAVLMVTGSPMVYYRGGRLFVPWKQFCGKLFLTSVRLVFLSGWGHLDPQCLWLPLREVEWAESCSALGMQNGLRVRMAGGEEFLFNLGAINYPDAEGWAARILRESRRPRGA